MDAGILLAPEDVVAHPTTSLAQGEHFAASNTCYQRHCDTDIDFQGDTYMPVPQLGEDDAAQGSLLFRSDNQNDLQATTAGISHAVASHRNTTPQNTAEAAAALTTGLAGCSELDLCLPQFKFEGSEDKHRGREEGVKGFQGKDEWYPGRGRHLSWSLAGGADLIHSTTVAFDATPMLEPPLELARGPVAGPPPPLSVLSPLVCGLAALTGLDDPMDDLDGEMQQDAYAPLELARGPVAGPPPGMTTLLTVMQVTLMAGALEEISGSGGDYDVAGPGRFCAQRGVGVGSDVE